ncbi:GNAT family N-acetyltransferase [Streptomyces albiaxialis]|uniref:GNAT family N-acetyltransferase n=1 Tax=Streptomyces albiaxialis TaxID=329523 RepID=A0ABP5HA15_9ACTN
MRLHVVTERDWPLWRDARLAALSQDPHAFTARLADWPDGGEEQWHARLRMPGTHNLVALVDGRTAGTARGVPVDEATKELRSLWVSPEARGLGVADALIAEIERWARQQGASALRLAVLPDNAPALALYRRKGFVPDGERHGPAREQIMVKYLD